MILERLVKPRASISTSSELDAFLRMGQNSSASGVPVNEQTALAVTAVYACVRVLAESVAQTPLILYRRLDNGGKERATDHWLYPVLHRQPNDWMTAFGFKEMMQAHCALRGNAYAFRNVVRTGRLAGRVREILPIHPDRVEEVEQDERWRITYKIRMPDGGLQEYPPEQILHVPGMSFDGVTGLSPLHAERNAIGFASAMDEFGSKLFQNGARPGGVLKHPKTLSEAAHKHLEESFAEQHAGSANAFKTLILEEGMDWSQVGMNAEDAQFLETKKYQASEIARIFRVPPHMIGDLERATFSNIEQQSLEFVKYTLAPWLTRWEQALTMQLLPERDREEYFLEFNVEGLLRGDTQVRYEGYNSAITTGWMTRNEARVRENLNPLPGLDEPLLPMNMTPDGEESDADSES